MHGERETADDTLPAQGRECRIADHVSLKVARYEDSHRLCYVRGSEGIIVELAQQIG